MVTTTMPTAQAPVRSSLSTDAVTPDERIEFWRGVIREKILPVDFRVDDRKTFSAGLASATVGDVQVTDLHISAHIAECGRTATAHDHQNMLIFNFMHSGRGVSAQDGRRIALAPGSGMFCTSARPFTLEFPEQAHLTVLRIPRAALERSVASIERIANQNLAPGNQVFPLVVRYVEQLAHAADGMTPAAAARVSANLIDLVGAMVAESAQQTASALSECRVAALLRLRAFIEQHIDDPELGPAEVASALGLSQRYINKLLEAEDTSLGRLIWQRRLDLIAADLRNGALASRSISTIALARGFNDLAHFSKRFRKHFGVSPREYRMANLR